MMISLYCDVILVISQLSQLILIICIVGHLVMRATSERTSLQYPKEISICSILYLSKVLTQKSF